jgi:hypothetical protein
MAINRNQLSADIASLISDYREGEIVRPNQAHVLQWVNQFTPHNQDIILEETFHYLQKLYVSKQNVEDFILKLSENANITGGNPATFWGNSGFLRLQDHSQSQNKLLNLLESVLIKTFNVNCQRAISLNQTYIYIDDGLFSGNQIKGEIADWIETSGVRDCQLHIIVMGLHKAGWYYANKALSPTAQKHNVKIHWWMVKEIDNWTKAGTDPAPIGVFWPTSLPADINVQRWLARCPDDNKYFTPRPVLQNGRNHGYFKSEAGRNILEQEFLSKGAYIRNQYQNPSDNMHPLGFNKLKGAGFGAMFTTFQNCPNNAPLALWWSLNGWHPLLERRTRI